MKKAILSAPARIEVVESDPPEIREDEVLIKVQLCGICGSDLHAYEGKNKGVPYPTVPGHEMVGEIVAVGARVTQFRAGDLVTAEPAAPCGKCMYCAQGDYRLCIDPAPWEGAFADFIAIKEAKTFLVPRAIERAQATLIEPLACAVHAVRTAGSVKGARVLIHGAGTIGNLIGQVARAAGAAHVTITDLHQQKLDLALRVGIDAGYRNVPGQGEAALVEAVGTDRIDVAFDCVCIPFTLNTAIRCLKKGGTLMVIGVPSGNVSVDMVRVMANEIRMQGCLMYRDDFPRAIELLAAGAVRVDGFLSATFPLSEISEAFRSVLANQDRYVKCLIQP